FAANPPAVGQHPCPKGFRRANGSCVDVDECQEGGFCKNGLCTNTRGSFACLCHEGFILDSSRSSCISHQVISEARGPCYRVLREGRCALPTLRNITRQICCCSRVGKAWGPACQRCPPFGSEGFKEICPAGPGYHYSASDLRYNTRYLGQDLPRVPLGRPRVPSPAGTAAPRWRPGRPPPSRSPPVPEVPPRVPKVPQRVPEVPPRIPHVPQPAGSVCERNPRICGPGRCVPRQGGYTCLCHPGFWLSTQGTHCIDVDECAQSPSPCAQSRCKNLPGGYRCVCPAGYQASTPTGQCQDIDECENHLACPGQECANTPGSFQCRPCRDGFELRHGRCADVDECATGSPCGPHGRCSNTEGSFHCQCRRGCRHRALCPHGTGQTTGPQGSAADVDECRVFAPQLCRGGVCINAAPGFSCYCPSGYYYEQEHLQCVDNDECQDEDAEPCIGGRCVNTVGSYFCSCAPPLVLDGSQRRCVTNDTRAMGEATPCHPPRVTVTPPVSPCPHVSPYPCPMSPWPPIPVSRHCPLMPPPCPHVPHPDVPRHRVPTSCVPIPPWRCIPHVPKSPCPRVPMSHILMSHVTVSPRPVSPYPHGAVSPMSPNPRVPVSPCPMSPPLVPHPPVPRHHIPVSPCPHVPHPFIPVSPIVSPHPTSPPHVPTSLCPHVPVSPYPHVPMTPQPRGPIASCCHAPVSPTAPCPLVPMSPCP
ncbi:latent-transforming growth factor beta-binding protein 4-like, partial [Anas platyrhynchos]|uniref:latent-transforming growth factor beta-binding protein 4-like n=1 Tax=Anas platyrhynchos TaxID=8839 RepID=UPI003AF200EE